MTRINVGGSGGSGSAAPSGAAGGDLTGTYPDPAVAAGAITLAKQANIANNTILGNQTGGAAAPVALTVAQVKTLLAISLTADVTGLLPVANGGSGVGTLTGILKGNGTSAFTAVTAPAGAIVGTTDAQTLTNKVLTTPTGLVKGDVGLGNVDNTSNATERAAVADLTNKRVIPLVAAALTDAATTAWNVDNGAKFTLLATSGVGNTRALGDPSGTVKDGESKQIVYTQDATGGRALTVSGTGVKIGTSLGGGTTVPLDTSANTVNVIHLITVGSTLYVVSAFRVV